MNEKAMEEKEAEQEAVKITVPAELNEGQVKAFVSLHNFITGKSDSEMMLLEGFAGTGKTYLLSKLIDQLIDQKVVRKVAMTAPTNKAVKVLARMSRGLRTKGVDFITVHKLLGLKEKINDNGTITFEADSYQINSSPEDYDLVVVDEVSMLHDDLYKDLHRHSGYVKFIFTGDPAQIPPVGLPNSIPLTESKRTEHGIERVALDQIVRQKEGNPIIEAAFQVRSNLSDPYIDLPTDDWLTPDGHGVHYIDVSEKQGRDKLNELMSSLFVSEQFKADADHAKVLAWRNVTVANFNSIIRNMIYPDKAVDGILPKILDGEKLLANSPIVADFKIILFSTNDEFEVISHEVRYKTVATETTSVRLAYYRAQVAQMDAYGKLMQPKSIDILHENSKADFDLASAALKRTAIETKGANRAWVRYYDFLRCFADVGYNYSLTCHKCVHEDSLVLLKSGNAHIKDVTVGDEVWSKNGFSKITNKWESNKPGLRITTRTGRTIITSDEHLHKQLVSRDGFSWIRANKLDLGDSLLTPRSVIGCTEQNDLMWLYGIIMGDGSFSDNIKNDGRIEIAFNPNEPNNIEEISNIVQANIGRYPKIRSGSMYFNSKSFRAELLACGFGYKEKVKFIPSDITTGLSSFIRGLMDADGSVGANIRFVNVSLQMIKMLQQYLLQYGVISSYHLCASAGPYACNGKLGKLSNRRDAYTLTISCPDSVKRYAEYIGFTNEKKAKKLQVLIDGQRHGKTNIDYVPLFVRAWMKEVIQQTLSSDGGRGSKGKGLMGSKHYKLFSQVFYSDIKNFSWVHLTELIAACEYYKITVPHVIMDLKDQFYFFDTIVKIEKVENLRMIDIEVADTHEFNCEGFSVHNCQGSTYTNVIVAEDDLNMNRNVVERNRIKYTAFSRASERLYRVKMGK